MALKLHCDPFKKLTVSQIVHCLEDMRQHKWDDTFSVTLDTVDSPHHDADWQFLRSITEQLQEFKARHDDLVATNKTLQQQLDYNRQLVSQQNQTISTLQQTLSSERTQHEAATITAQRKLYILQSEQSAAIQLAQERVQDIECM